MKQRGALRTQRTAKDLADLLIGFMADTSALQISPFTKYIHIYMYTIITLLKDMWLKRWYSTYNS